MRCFRVILAVAAVSVLLLPQSCYRGPTAFDATLYPGTWSGSWSDTTSQGTITVLVSLNSATSILTFSVDVDGSTLVDSVSIDGTYGETELTVSASTSELGYVEATLAGGGSLSGSAYPPGADSVSFSGSWSDTLLILSYEVSLFPEVYTGTISLTKQPWQ